MSLSKGWPLWHGRFTPPELHNLGVVILVSCVRLRKKV